MRRECHSTSTFSVACRVPRFSNSREAMKLTPNPVLSRRRALGRTNKGRKWNAKSIRVPFHCRVVEKTSRKFRNRPVWKQRIHS